MREDPDAAGEDQNVIQVDDNVCQRPNVLLPTILYPCSLLTAVQGADCLGSSLSQVRQNIGENFPVALRFEMPTPDVPPRGWARKLSRWPAQQLEEAQVTFLEAVFAKNHKVQAGVRVLKQMMYEHLRSRSGSQ